MRIIRINPFDRVVEELDIVGESRAFYEALSGPGFPIGGLAREQMTVVYFDIVSLAETPSVGRIDMFVDDEGRLRSDQACFRLRGSEPFAGRAFLACSDQEGETVDLHRSITLAHVRGLVEWLPYDFDYTPPPPTVIGFESLEMLRFLRR